ncbi:Tim44/TimA family putative adaptor protein [Arenibaculum pallidiluteum]|uniref:Tim44/TimA family putative adaptor protein n=1 Tax=Arenibaculum pallidiluteum TaxID=2812559 RepID=UPI001A957839|nr:Tim44/TimA family putative adaptor protein [Arenibaculum pallidiluteum]
MGEGSLLIDVVIFGMIAVFLVYRLRSVLGRRHGEERQRPNPFAAPPKTAVPESRDNVVPLPGRPRPASAEPGAAADEPQSLAASIAAVRAADPTFDEKTFLEGARAAFGMIVGAFAEGDTATLRPLLSDEVYGNFAAAIRERQARRETLETRIVAIDDTDLAEAALDGRTALITVRFVSHQINVTRDAQGAVVDGDAERPVEVVDIWTFARDTRSRDPNWTLVETRVPQ